MMKRFCLFIAVAPTLTGCANGLNFTPTMASDPPYLGGEGTILQTGMLEALEKVTPTETETETAQQSLCKKITRSKQEYGSKQSKKYQTESYGEIVNDDYPFQCYRFIPLQNDIDQKTKVTRYLDSGIALTDYYCDIYFNRISERTSKRHFARSGVNDVGAAISAVLGLASAGSAVTGGIGAGFGLIDSTIRNYDEAFVVDADIPALQKLVRAEQETLRRDIFAKDNAAFPKSYEAAAIVIMRYANTCSFTGMRGLLTESMLEKANAARNPLDGTRISDFMKMTVAQKKAVVEMLKTQNSPPEPPTQGEPANPPPP